MTPALDLSRWRETPRGIGYRRWTIVAWGLQHLFRTRLFIVLLFTAWTAGMLLSAFAFLFAQSVASGGWLEALATNMGPRAQAVVSALGGLMLLYPDVCIGGLFTLIFWLHSFVGLSLSLVALTLLVPRLIARDRASNALTIYLSRPLTSTDYLLGKLGTIVGVLLLMWTGPLVLGWVLSVLLAPDREFIVYSFSPFTRALLFNAIGLVVLAATALGVSAVNRTARPTIVLWIALWVIAGAIARLPKAPEWLVHTSFTHNLGEVRKHVFRLDHALIDAGTKLPLLSEQMTRNLHRTAGNVRASDIEGPLIGLGVLTLLSSAIFLRRLRPE
jgi:ABC-2 type transport system permease protein